MDIARPRYDGMSRADFIRTRQSRCCLERCRRSYLKSQARSGSSGVVLSRFCRSPSRRSSSSWNWPSLTGFPERNAWSNMISGAARTIAVKNRAKAATSSSGSKLGSSRILCSTSFRRASSWRTPDVACGRPWPARSGQRIAVLPARPWPVRGCVRGYVDAGHGAPLTQTKRPTDFRWAARVVRCGWCYATLSERSVAAARSATAGARNPLNVSHRPSESSHAAMSRPKAKPGPET